MKYGEYVKPKDLKQMSMSELRHEMIKKKARTKLILDKEDENMKQILSDVTGFVCPGEVVGIMGSSGSGKTSLLNILGQRMNSIQTYKLNGSIKCNGVELGMG